MSKPAWALIIEQLMKDAGISQRELAKRSGVGRSALRRAISGKVSPSLETIEKTLDVFEYDLDAIPRLHPDKAPVNDFTSDVEPEKPVAAPRLKIEPHFGGRSDGC